ncbi:hypothetical protein [Caminibacter sp.]
MKKLLSAAVIGSFLFAGSSTDDINKKLDLLLQKIEQLEKKVDKKDTEIEQLKKELKKQQTEMKKQKEETKKEFAIKSCKGIKVVSLEYTYHDEVIPYYDLTVTLKNTYPQEVVLIRGSLFAEDKDGVKILHDYISRKVDLKPGEEIVIRKKHLLNSELEEYLKDEKPENLKLYFEPSRVEFKNGHRVECGGFGGVF